VSSQLLIKILLIEYVVIMAVCVWEKNWARTLYWAGAAVLQVSILWGMR
jgi:hypothetical protein